MVDLDSEKAVVPTDDGANQVPDDNVLIPGTQYMGGADGFHLGGKQTVDEPLYPHPTTDPADPLNWSPLWKGLAIANVALCTFWFAVSAISMAPLFPLFIQQWDLTPNQVSMTTGITILLLGVSNVACVPISNIYGRRTALLLFGSLFLACNLWEGLARSYPNFLAARAITGIAAAPCETLVVQVITDVFFLHERGSWVGFAMVSCFLGTFIGPVISGAMAKYGWPSFFWLSLGTFGFTMICLIFSFPETKWRRSADANITTSATSQQEQSILGRGGPVKRQFMPYQRPDPRWKSYLVRDVLVPFRIAYYPIVLYAALCLTVAADLTLVWNISESFVFGAPPYNFSPQSVGFTNFGMAGGLILGMLTAGPLSDYVVARAVRRNNGIREAEMRLPALVPYFIIITIGVSIAAAGLKYEWPWAVIVIFGFGSAGLALSSIPTIGITYAIDCYKPISGEIMVVGTVIKNTAGFSFAYWLPDLGLTQGFHVPLLAWYAFVVLTFLCAVPLYLWGKRLRQMTRDSHVHALEEIL